MIEIIPAALAGERVDRVVAILTGLTRSQVAALVEQGDVSLDGKPVRSRSLRVQEGDALKVPDAPPEAPTTLVGDAGVPFTVVYQDEAVLVVDKPAGVVVHPGAGQRGGTLVAGLLHRFPDLATLAVGGAEQRPGIVHRLDKGTSGLLVVARTEGARDALMGQLAARSAHRSYQALVWGRIDGGAGLIDAPLGRAASDPTKMAIRTGGKAARTRYRVERRFSEPAEATLVACVLETGRTHQIRVHLAAIGHPVVGDVRYHPVKGGGSALPGATPGWPRLAPQRLWLHAAQLGFVHPASGEAMTFTSPLPEDLQGFLGHFDQG